MVALRALVLVLTTTTIACAEPTRVMSFNIRYGTAPDGANHWERRRDLVFDSIRAYDPDLLGVQEMLAFQRDELLGALEEYQCVGVGRDDGADSGEFSAIFYRTERYVHLDSGTRWLCDTPEAPGALSWDAQFPRTFCWALLTDRRNEDKPLLFISTHWDHQSENSRRRSGEMLGKWIKSEQHVSRLVVVGDFNCGPESEGITHLKRLAGLRDPFLTELCSTPELGTFHAFTGEPKTERIDTVLLGPAWRATEVKIVRSNQDGRYPSDHFPVTTVIEPTGLPEEGSAALLQAP